MKALPGKMKSIFFSLSLLLLLERKAAGLELYGEFREQPAERDSGRMSTGCSGSEKNPPRGDLLDELAFSAHSHMPGYISGLMGEFWDKT